MRIVSHVSVSVITLLILLSGLNLHTTANPPQDKETIQEEKTLALYFFHRSRRCFSCNAIENNTKKTLESQFAEQLENGKISFRVFNVDQPENQAISRKFKATGTSLFLSEKDGEEEIITNLSMMAMKNARNESAFAEEFSKIIREALGE